MYSFECISIAQQQMPQYPTHCHRSVNLQNAVQLEVWGRAINHRITPTMLHANINFLVHFANNGVIIIITFHTMLPLALDLMEINS